MKITPNCRVKRVDDTGLRYGPVEDCAGVYDGGEPLQRVEGADVPAGGWALQDGVIVLGHFPDGMVTADIAAPGAVTHLFEPWELVPGVYSRRGPDLIRAGLMKL